MCFVLVNLTVVCQLLGKASEHAGLPGSKGAATASDVVVFCPSDLINTNNDK